jgi:hypothetical protein
MRLHVRVFEAAHLPALDVVGRSDPYVKLRIRGRHESQSTTVKPATLNPVWGEDFHLDIVSISSDVLRCRAFDRDVAFDDRMGFVDIQLSRLPLGALVDSWYPLTPTPDAPTPGELRLLLHVTAIDQPAFTDFLIPSQLLKLTINEAREQAPEGGPFFDGDSLITVNLTNTKLFQKGFKFDAAAPPWAETFDLLLTDVDTDTVEILIQAQKPAGLVELLKSTFPASEANSGFEKLYPLGVDGKGKVLVKAVIVEFEQKLEPKEPGLIVQPQ